MKHWHNCQRWWLRGQACPFRPPEEEEREREQEQEPRDLQEEEAIRQSEVVAEAGLRQQRRIHARFQPALSFAPKGLGDQVGVVEAITVARGIKLPTGLEEVGRLTQAAGHFEDVRENRTVRVPAKAKAPAEALQLELLAGLPGVDPRVAIPPGVPFVPADAGRAEAIVAHYIQQVQSEETGAAKGVAVGQASRAVATSAEFGEMRQRTAALTILASLGVSMRGMERANLLGTQHGVNNPVQAPQRPGGGRSSGLSTPGRPTIKGVGPNVIKPSLFSGSGDFKSFGQQIGLTPGLQRTTNQ